MLELQNISIAYGEKEVVRNVSLRAEKGEIVGIVGESGSGKSTLIRGIIGLLDCPGKIIEGKILLNGRNIAPYPAEKMREIRGKEIAMIFQHADLSLDPLWTIGKSFYESISMHKKISKQEAMACAAERLKLLSLKNPEKVLNLYPHQLSGGMCQRTAIAIAMANDPELLLADEPTSALDLTVQNQVIENMMSIREQRGTTILIVTHNMGVVEKMADKVGVMYRGRLVEWGSKDEVLHDPKHAYTQSLIRAIPKMDGTLPQAPERCIYE